MKIHNIPGVINSYNQNKVKATAKSNNISSKKDAMSLSSQAQVMNKAFQGAKNAPDIREDKVNQLKNAIKLGTYSVSNEDVAEKILNGLLFNKKA